MGFQDRPYYQQPPDDYGPTGPYQYRSSGLGLPPLTTWVKYLIIINCLVFLLQMLIQSKFEHHNLFERWFVVSTESSWTVLQVWRLITFQFLHADFGHLFGNMLGLYFFGTMLERFWGGRNFLFFYLTCGIIAGLVYIFACAIGFFPSGKLVGASGGILGILAACAVLFPQTKVLFYFIIPMSIRTLIIIISLLYIINVTSKGRNAGGDAAHLGGMAAGFLWVWKRDFFTSLLSRRRPGTFRSPLQNDEKLRYEIDRILAKIHDQGIQSLTQQEKQTLSETTKQKN